MILKFLVHSNVLKMLDLWMNILHGTIPATFAKGNTFRNFNLNGNQLEGLLPQTLANFRNLEVLDLGSNKINRTFPYWLEGLLKLQVLAIRSKKLQGRIDNPKTNSPFPNLRIIGISNNDFNGPLLIKYLKYLSRRKSCYEIYRSWVLSRFVEYNDYWVACWVGDNQNYLHNSWFLNNSFTVEMPKIIGMLNSLKGLKFSHNNLIGYILSSFGNLTNLE